MREGHGTRGGLLQELKPPASIIDAASALIDMPEDTLAQIAAKQAAFAKLHKGESWQNLKKACDLYVTAFFAPKIGKQPTAVDLGQVIIPLTDHVWSAARGQPVQPHVIGSADEMARNISAFHWPLEFPHVFARGGFDVVVGNPPWEVSQLGEQEYFAAKSPEIASLPGEASAQ